MRACWASMREFAKEPSGADASSNPFLPACQVAQLAIDTHSSAISINAVAYTNPLLKRRLVRSVSQYWPAPSSTNATTRPDRGIHCGLVKRSCWSVTACVVKENNSPAAGRICSRIKADASAK